MWATLQSPKILNENRRGFTIVELLIVVVVIAILAAITIVSYNGIQNRAKASAAQQASSQANKKILLYALDNADSYPEASGASGIDNLSAIGITNNSGTSYQYSANNSLNPKTFCITATVSNFSYYQSSVVTKSTAGSCPGHGLNGVASITNLVVNPSVELNTAGFNNNNASSSVARSTDQSYSGTASLLVTSVNTNSGYNGVSRAMNVVAGKTYTLSGWVYLNTAYGAGIAATTNGAGTSVKQGNIISTTGSWQKTSVTFTPTTTGNASIYFITPTGSTAVANSSFYTDAWMFTEGTDTYQYNDGSTGNNWVWDIPSAPHASTSTGPGFP